MSPHFHSADRNLLFGIIALQMDFISRDQLIAAMAAWVMDKHKPLGQILSEQGVLSPEDHEAIESLVRRHLLRHANDAERSLAALSSIGQRLRDDLSRIADPDLEASLPRVGAARGDTESTLTYLGSPTTPGGRFRILRPHAQGGLGVVSVALDEELHREVALKEIQERYAGETQPRLRFLLEAEITGGLEHPGIVPVYGLGHHPDGRPFYAMRFVRGESLKEAIARFHGEPGRVSAGSHSEPGRVSAGSRSKPRGANATPLAFRRLLSRFLDVCNAIAYAHSRGVLHRDIKPGNILLGPYGETLVVDWGLAKVIGRDEPDTSDPNAEPTLRPPSASGTGETVPGTALGTPAYMSPEQAAGRLDLLGPASDVYSLGATLYVVLTGRAPFNASGAAEVLAKVQRGDFARPRAVNPSVPKPLEAICVKAMALKQADRYATPRALAEDIEHWLADEPVVAYREPWPDRARRWSRKHRTLVTSAAVVLLLGLLGSVGFAAVVTGKNRELAKQTARAEKREEMAVKAVERFRDVILEEPVLKDNRALEDLRKKLLKAPLDFFKSLREQLQADKDTGPDVLARLAGAAHDYAHLAEDIGDIQDSLRSHIESLAIWERLVRDHPAKTDYQQWQARIENCRGNMLSHTGQRDQALQAYEKGLAIQTRLVRTHPGETEFQHDLATTQHNIGGLQHDMGHPDLALGALGKALAIRERLARDNPSVIIFQGRLAAVYNNIGSVYTDANQPDLALEPFSKGLAIQERLAREHPNVAEFQRGLADFHNNIGILQRNTGHPDKALESHGKAHAIWDRLAHDNPSVTEFQSELANTSEKIGELQRVTGHPDQALESHGKALAIRERLARTHLGVTGILRDLANSHKSIGATQRDTGRRDEALESYGKALAIQERLAREHPSVTEFQRDLGSSHVETGDLQSDAGRFDLTLESYVKALAISDRLARANPTVAQFQRDLAVSHNNVALIQEFTGHPDQALESHGKALAIRERLARDNPSVIQFQSDAAQSHNNIGCLQSNMGHPDQASASHGTALAIQRRLVREHPASTDDASGLGGTLNNMAMIDLAAKRFEQARDKLREAISWQKKALAANPRNPIYRQFLGNHLRNLIKAANALGNVDDFAEAQRELDELAATDPAKVALDRRLAAVIRGEPPKDNRERLQLAYRAYEKKLNAASARLYAEALQADPKLAEDREAPHRYNAACAASLAASAKNTPTLPSPIKGEEKTDTNAVKGVNRAESKNSSPLVGEDTGGGSERPLTDGDRAKLRNQAHVWLEAELATWTRLLGSANVQQRQAVAKTLKHWQEDTDLAGVRDEVALAKLPGDEREGWKSLWAKVDALLTKARKP